MIRTLIYAEKSGKRSDLCRMSKRKLGAKGKKKASIYSLNVLAGWWCC
jgi:hypothetical protein